MSELNRGGADEGGSNDGEAPNQQLLSSTTTSASGSCSSSNSRSGSTSSTSGSGTSGSQSGSDNSCTSDIDGESLFRQRHGQRREPREAIESASRNENIAIPGTSTSSLDQNQNQHQHNKQEVIDTLKPATATTTGLYCDSKDIKCPFQEKSSVNLEAKTDSKQIGLTKTDHATIPQMIKSQTENIQHLDEADLVEHSKLNERLSSSSFTITASNQQHQNQVTFNPSEPTSLGSSYSNISFNNNLKLKSNELMKTGESTIPRRILRPAPSPSPSLGKIDSNNNKNKEQDASSKPGSASGGGGGGGKSESLLSNLKRGNFSKSASGSRLMSTSNNNYNKASRPLNVCDCLTPDCGEKKHSNRRQFIEQYYNSRTQLPSATSTSSFNINTPLNRLSECDAITKRLLSSPIRTINNQVESPTRRVIVNEVDKSRRASLGTNTMTDPFFLFSSNPFKSLELSFINKNKNQQKTSSSIKADNRERKQTEKCAYDTSLDVTTTTTTSGDNDFEQQQQQQQGRSLSVCDEETLNPRLRGTNTNNSSNLNRAISLACETRQSHQSSRRLLTIIPLFGCDLKSLEQFTKLGSILPPIIDSVIDYILVNGINSIGIFRKSGVKSRILSLRQQIEGNQSLKFKDLNQNNEFSIYDIADLVKMWFRELKPLPLLTKELIKLIIMLLNSSQKQVDSNLRMKINSVTTQTHRAILAKALDLLQQISVRWETNQMTSQNLAICLTPSLCETESDQDSILIAQKALEFCIENHRKLLLLN